MNGRNQQQVMKTSSGRSKTEESKPDQNALNKPKLVALDKQQPITLNLPNRTPPLKMGGPLENIINTEQVDEELDRFVTYCDHL